MPEVILGLNAYHADSAACLMVDGELLAAAEEERFRRVKHWAGFPENAIRYCLGEAGLSLEDVDHVAVNRDPRAALLSRVRFVLTRRPTLGLYADRLRNARAWGSISKRLADAFPDQRYRGAVHHVEHHEAHVLSAFLVSPFDDAVLLSLDAGGDFASAGFGVGSGTTAAVDGRVYFPHSLGVFYSALTQFLGFPRFGDEYKVMGLAPYGRPAYADRLGEVVTSEPDGTYRLSLRYFRHHREALDYRWNDSEPIVTPVYSDELVELLGPPRSPDDEITDRHADIAASLQAVYEQRFFELLNALHSRYGLDSLVLAGGCAMNSVANGKITLRTPFRRTYIPPAPGDAGGAIGAALWAWRRQNAARDGRALEHPLVMSDALWGPSFSRAQIEELLTAHERELRQAGTTVELIDDEASLCERTARALADGRVVGWFHGRMEWGPRALGARSIVCDPRRSDMKALLNRKVKRRESFRPFAPSILRHAVPEWCELDGDVPFMGQVFPVREEKRELIPAVTHVDGSARLQTVDAEANPRYHRMIAAFDRLTGVPMVLNTSFNENEPIVCTPAQALDCFLRTSMDVLVLEDFFVARA